MAGTNTREFSRDSIASNARSGRCRFFAIGRQPSRHRPRKQKSPNLGGSGHLTPDQLITISDELAALAFRNGSPAKFLAASDPLPEQDLFVAYRGVAGYGRGPACSE